MFFSSWYGLVALMGGVQGNGFLVLLVRDSGSGSFYKEGSQSRAECTVALLCRMVYMSTT